jgi:WD40 repeat protein
MVAMLVASCTGEAADEGKATSQAVSPGKGSVKPIGKMAVPRSCHTATTLPGGKVLVAGGMQRDGVFTASAELYDPATDTFTPTGSMIEMRACPTATLLANGKVLIAGGSTREWLQSAELYDPAKGTFIPTGSMGKRRGGHTATLLPDGKVLIVGGNDGSFHNSTEVYDPATGQFTPHGTISEARASHIAALLSDGKVLIAGGNRARSDVLTSAELYDPGTGTSRNTGSMAVPRYKHAAALLPNGSVLVVGGSDSRDWRGRYSSAEIYDPAKGAFSPTGEMASARFKLMDALALLPSGRLLVGGGSERVEIYNPATGAFDTAEGELDAARFYSAAAVMPGGKVLITGGYDTNIATTDQAWLYTEQPESQSGYRTFPETGKTVQGVFLWYWERRGGLAQQGYPISAEMQEKSDTDGKTYTVQYFERSVFELHVENDADNIVLLSLLGNFRYRAKYPNGAPNQQPNTEAGSRLFPETGKRVGGVFLDYWLKNGGLAQQGYPVSDEFTEVSDLNGKPYKVQYFERAVFEHHPENQAPYNVLLSQLGTFRYREKVRAGQLPSGQMAFSTMRDRNWEIYLMDADGSNLRNLTNNPASDRIPAWSPDGRQIAFVSNRDGGQLRLYLMNADGSNQRRLSTNNIIETQPAWSPDGKQIAFASQDKGDNGIYVMNADGSNLRRLTQGSGADGFPTWSPDGRQIAFMSDTEGTSRQGNLDIYVMNADGSNLRRLTDHPADEGLPSWSRGGHIAFAGSRDGDREVYVMNADGSNLRRLAPNQPGGHPAWSPDGKFIAFVTVFSNNAELAVMRADSSNMMRVTSHPADDWVAAWDPTQGDNNSTPAGGNNGASTPTTQRHACAATVSDPPGPYVPGASARGSVGKGHVVRGVVQSSRDCAPIAGAMLEMWPAGLDDKHHDNQRATVFTNSSGAYEFECEPAQHIHMRVSAKGFKTIFTNAYHPRPGEAEGTFDVVLAPEGP